MRELSERSHYLPQFYQRGFAGVDGRVCVFDRETNEFRPQPPVNTAVERGFYTLVDKNGVKSDGIERMFAGLENEVSDVIRRLDNGTTAEWRCEQERVSFAIFIAYFYTRTPAFRREQSIFTEQMYRARMKAEHLTKDDTARALQRFAEATGEEVDEETIQQIHETFRDGTYKVEVPRELSVRLMVDTALHLAGTLLTLDWVFVRSPPDLAFITSDAPFAVAPPPGEDESRAYGILTPGAASSIPLSSKTCLVIQGEGGRESYCRIQKDDARRINENVATNSARFVIGRDQPYLERLAKHLKLDQYRWTSRFICDTSQIDGEIVFHAKRSERGEK
jgi:Protein of unknown function (DUF4238)